MLDLQIVMSLILLDLLFTISVVMFVCDVVVFVCDVVVMYFLCVML